MVLGAGGVSGGGRGAEPAGGRVCGFAGGSTGGGAPPWVRSLSVRAIRRFTIHPVLPQSLDPLRSLMLNLRWSWDAQTRELFAAIDPANRALAQQDPVALLASVAQSRLTALAAADPFLGRLAEAGAHLRDALAAPRW